MTSVSGGTPGHPRSQSVSKAQPPPEQADKSQKSYDLFFPKVIVPPDAGISLVRVVVTCGHVAAVMRIPDDWYVRTLRPAVQSGPEWKEFQFAWSAVEFEAGHGVTRQPDIKPFDGAVRLVVEDEKCFDIVVDIKDDLGPSEWKVRLRKAQLQLRK
jgi:hypothetical protein